MGAAELFWPTIQTVGTIFAGGAALVLGIGRCNLRRIAGGELGARYLGWLFLTPLYLLAIFAGGPVGLALLAAAIGTALLEYGRAMGFTRRDLALLGGAAALTLAVVLWAPLLFGPLPALILLLLSLGPILSGTPELWAPGHAPTSETTTPPFQLFRGYLYTVWTLAHAVLLYGLPDGRGFLVVAIAGCALADVGAYCVGKAFGRHPIAPRINPKKAWEGLLGDLLGAGIAVVLFRFGLPSATGPALAGLALLIALGSAWGDLLSSMAKRIAGIKDWGSAIPGHGGLLDRLNSLIVVMPLVYYYAVLLG